MAGICKSYKEQLLYEKNTSAAFSGFLEPFVLYIFFPSLWMPFKPVLPFTGRAWEHLYNDNWNVLNLLHFTANQEKKNPLFTQLSVDLQWWNCSEAALTGMWALAEPGEGICLPCTLSPPWFHPGDWGACSSQQPVPLPAQEEHQSQLGKTGKRVLCPSSAKLKGCSQLIIIILLEYAPILLRSINLKIKSCYIHFIYGKGSKERFHDLCKATQIR